MLVISPGRGLNEYTPRGFGQLNSLFRSKHGVVYTYELVKSISGRVTDRGGKRAREGLI